MLPYAGIEPQNERDESKRTLVKFFLLRISRLANLEKYVQCAYCKSRYMFGIVELGQSFEYHKVWALYIKPKSRA